jgi:hypothetical protein
MIIKEEYMKHDYEKKYFEFLALKILKEYQNVNIEGLINEEKPDWQDISNSLGIEITRNSEGTQFWRALEKVKKPIADKKIKEFNKRFKKNGGKVITIEDAKIIYNDMQIKDYFGFNEKYFYIIPSYDDNFSTVNKSIIDKIKKLNIIYNKNIKDNRLFIFSPIFAFDECFESEMKEIIKIQNEYTRKYNIVYICLLYRLLVFNFNENNWNSIQMNKDVINKLSEEANKEAKSLT